MSYRAGQWTQRRASERPAFAHHPGDVSSLLNIVQNGCERQDVAKESLDGSQSVGYSSEQVPIEKIFSEVRLIEAHEVLRETGDTSQGTGAESERMTHNFAERAEQAKCVHMEDVLGQSSRVLVLGDFGSGKTMWFYRKVPLEWARGERWRQIELLFALSLKENVVHTAETLDKLIQLELLGFVGKDKVDTVCSYISDHGERVCFLFDGLDEVQFDKCSDFVQKIIQGKELTKAHVVVTSRPSEEALILDRKYPFKTRLELMGFGRAGMAEYSARVLQKEHAEDFMRQVAACPQLATLLQSPVNCVSACAVYRTDTNKFPPTLPATYTAIMDGVARHTQNKLRNGNPVSTDWSKVDAELQASAKLVAAFAFTDLAERIAMLSQNSRDKDRLVNNEDITLEYSPRFDSPGQIPEEVASSANRGASSTSPAVAACSSSQDGPSSYKEEDDPWNHPMFGPAHGNLVKANADILTLHTFSAGLIMPMEYRELQAIPSPLMRNAKLLSYLCIGGLESFKTFLTVLDKMGPIYDPVRRQMKELLPRK